MGLDPKFFTSFVSLLAIVDPAGPSRGLGATLGFVVYWLSVADELILE